MTASLPDGGARPAVRVTLGQLFVAADHAANRDQALAALDAAAIDVVRERNPSLANRRYSVVPRVD